MTSQVSDIPDPETETILTPATLRFWILSGAKLEILGDKGTNFVEWNEIITIDDEIKSQGDFFFIKIVFRKAASIMFCSPGYRTKARAMAAQESVLDFVRNQESYYLEFAKRRHSEMPGLKSTPTEQPVVVTEEKKTIAVLFTELITEIIQRVKVKIRKVK